MGWAPFPLVDPFSVAAGLLTPETAAVIRALIEEAICDQWSVRALADSVEAVLAPVIAGRDRVGGALLHKSDFGRACPYP